MIIVIKKSVTLKNTYVDLKREGKKYSVYCGEENGKIGEVLLPLKRDGYKGKILEQTDDTVKIQVITYANIHTHSGYSLLDGAIRIKDMVALTEYAGAITDHGVMYGFLEFYKQMKAAGKHPIIGFEAYTEDFDKTKKQNHMVLLASNEKGLKNLMKLSSEAYDNFYKKPHVSIEALRKHSEGIIATTACLGGMIPRLLLAGKIDEAEKAVGEFVAIFGKGNFFIEIQRHGISGEIKVEPLLIDLAKKMKVGIVAGVDAHYATREDVFAHEVLLCLQTGKKINEPHMKFDGSGYFMMSSEEMEEKFKDLPEALDNTLSIAERCHVAIDLNTINMPDYKIPEGFVDKNAYFVHLCEEGFRKRFDGTGKSQSSEYIDRFRYEIEMIKQMNFAEYFLIVWDFISFARNSGIMVGPGRGSVVGSLVAYCLEISGIDPIPYGLLFERFLNPERVSWPDIDSDFDDTRRDEVVQYLTQKYGDAHVCKIITFGSLKAKMAVRDVARVLSHPQSMGNRVAKLIPDELNVTLEKALIINAELQTAYDTEPDIRQIIDISKRLEGLPRHASQHACGLVISKDAVIENLPTVLAKNAITGAKEATSQVTMTEVEELGLLKMDILGLRTMGVIGSTLKMINDRHGKKISMSDIPLDDRRVYQFLKEGNTAGVFQIESPGMTNLIREIYGDVDIVPEGELQQLFERLIAAVALYRPGPMDYIPTYLKNITAPEDLQYDHPMLEPILKNTYGVIVYQEQVMQIVQKLAGYSLGRADIVRKAMGKKSLDVMKKEEKIFVFGNVKNTKEKQKVVGCVANGVPEDVARAVWDKMKRFAEYAFNKSHATAYAYIAVMTGWLSCYYPSEFMAASLNSVLDNSEKLKWYLYHCSKKKIEVLPPDVNLSQEEFAVDQGSIRFGLVGIKSISKSGSVLTSARGDKPFVDINDLVKRIGVEGGVNKTLVEALTYSGALDSFKGTRRSKIEATKNLLKEASDWKDSQQRGQMTLADLSDDFAEELKVKMSDLSEYEPGFKLSKEKEYAGFYLTGHPLDEYQGLIERSRQLMTIGNVLDTFSAGKTSTTRARIETAGMVTGVKVFYSKNGDPIYSFELEDRFHSIKCVVFASELEAVRGMIAEDVPLIIKGTFQESPDWGAQIIVSDIIEMDYLKSKNVPQSVIVTISSREEQLKLLQIVDDHSGSDTGVIILANERQFRIAKKIKYTPSVVSLLKDSFSGVKASF